MPLCSAASFPSLAARPMRPPRRGPGLLALVWECARGRPGHPGQSHPGQGHSHRFPVVALLLPSCPSLPSLPPHNACHHGVSQHPPHFLPESVWTRCRFITMSLTGQWVAAATGLVCVSVQLCARVPVCVCMYWCISAWVCACVHACVCMSVCACVCLRLCACVHVSVHLCIYAAPVCVCMHLYVSISVHVHVHMCVHAHVRMCVCVYVFVCVCASVCVCVTVSVCVRASVCTCGSVIPSVPSLGLGSSPVRPPCCACPAST